MRRQWLDNPGYKSGDNQKTSGETRRDKWGDKSGDKCADRVNHPATGNNSLHEQRTPTTFRCLRKNIGVFKPSFFPKTGRFCLGFRRFCRKKDPWKDWGRYPRKKVSNLFVGSPHFQSIPPSPRPRDCTSREQL